MFTGIIKQIAEIVSIQNRQIKVYAPELTVANIGDSYAVDGICLTVAAIANNILQFDLVAATLSATTAQDFRVGQKVHLEPALTVSSLVGGHIITGHVDTTLSVCSNSEVINSWQLELTYKAEHKPLLVPKGSVAINGVSLTIQKVQLNSFGVELIPETLRATNLACLAKGSDCNVEFDAISKTVWHQLQIIRSQ